MIDFKYSENFTRFGRWLLENVLVGGVLLEEFGFMTSVISVSKILAKITTYLCFHCQFVTAISGPP